MKTHAALIGSGLMAFFLSIVPALGQARVVKTQIVPVQAADTGAPIRPMPRIDAPIAPADLTEASGIDSGTTGAVMNEKDMLQYCVNISDSAREARYALIKKQLEESETEIDAKLAALDEKLDAIKAYVEVRDKFQEAAEKQVVGIFQAMRPDSAAQQLAQLDIRLAAAIIMKLDPKTSSIILGEMRPKAAATLASFMSVAMLPEDKEKELTGQ